MLISVKNRFVFVSNSKCASTSIERAFKRYAEIIGIASEKTKHADWLDILHDFHFLFEHREYSPDSFYRFGIMREPLSWVVSWYNYRMDDKRGAEALPPNTTFRQFWEMDDWVKYRRIRYQTISAVRRGHKNKALIRNHQRLKFLDSDGICRFNFILPYELLDKYIPYVCGEIGVQLKLPTRNVSTKYFSEQDIDDDLVSEIKSFYSDDYAFWMYWKAQCEEITAGVL